MHQLVKLTVAMWLLQLAISFRLIHALGDPSQAPTGIWTQIPRLRGGWLTNWAITPPPSDILPVVPYYWNVVRYLTSCTYYWKVVRYIISCTYYWNVVRYIISCTYYWKVVRYLTSCTYYWKAVRYLTSCTYYWKAVRFIISCTYYWKAVRYISHWLHLYLLLGNCQILWTCTYCWETVRYLTGCTCTLFLPYRRVDLEFWCRDSTYSLADKGVARILSSLLELVFRRTWNHTFVSNTWEFHSIKNLLHVVIKKKLYYFVT